MRFRHCVAFGLIAPTVFAALPTEDAFFSLSTDGVTLPDIGSTDNQEAVYAQISGAGIGTTSGTFQSTPAFDPTPFLSNAAANLDAIHYVHRDVPASFDDGAAGPYAFTIPAGSLIVSFDVDALTLTSDTVLAGVNDEDAALFIPTVAGDFSSGTWKRFFDGSDVLLTSGTEAYDIDAVCLVEVTVTAGDESLATPNLLVSFNGNASAAGNFFAQDIAMFRVTTYGADTAGNWGSPTVPIFQGGDVGLSNTEDIDSIELTTQAVQMGGSTIPSGVLIMSAGVDGTTLGGTSPITVNNDEVFVFAPTLLGGGAGTETQGTFVVLLDADPGLGIGTTPAIDAFSFMAFPEFSAVLTATDLDGGALVSGDTIECSLALTNTSTAHATGVSIAGTIDPNTESLAVTTLPTGTDASNATTLSITDIIVNPNSTVIFEWTADAVSGLMGGEVITMSGTVSAASQGGSGTTFSDSPGLTVQVPNLSTSTLVGADDDGGTLDPGDSITWTLTLNETANIDATVDVDDLLPSEVGTLSSAPVVNPPSGADNSSGSTVDIDAITVPANDSVSITYSTTLDAGLFHGSVIQNTAILTIAEGGAPVTVTDTSLPAVTNVPTINATLVGADDNGGLFLAGDPIEWVLTLTETAGAPASVDVQDALPAEVQTFTGVLVSPNSGSNTSTTTTLDLDGVAVAANGSTTITFTTNLDASGVAHGTVIQNSATVTVLQGGAVLTPTDTSLPAVTVLPSLSTTSLAGVDADGTPLEPGDVINWTLTLRETAGGPATVNVDDTLPPTVGNLNSVPVVSNASGTVNWTPGSNTFDIDNITVPANSNTVTVTYSSTVDMDVTPGASVQDDILVSVQGGGSFSRSDSLPTVTVVPNLASSSTQADDANGAPLMPVDTILYTVTLTNAHNTAASGVSLSGVIPATTENLLVLDAAGGSDGSVGDNLNVSNISVPALGSSTVLWQVNVKSNAGQNVPISMNVTVTAPGGTGANMTSNQLTTIPAELTLFEAD